MNRTEEIRRDLARTVIKEPLYAMIRDTANADRELAVIAENLGENYAAFHDFVSETHLIEGGEDGAV